MAKVIQLPLSANIERSTFLSGDYKFSNHCLLNIWQPYQACSVHIQCQIIFHGMLMPFGKYDQGSKQLNHYNSNVKHMRGDLRIPYISVSYNLQWGRQKRGAQKLIEADANADRSTVGGR